MTDRVKIGYVCGKGHTLYDGETDYSVCGTKAVANIYVSVEDVPDIHPSYKEAMSAEDIADDIKGIVSDWDRLTEEVGWGA